MPEAMPNTLPAVAAPCPIEPKRLLPVLGELEEPVKPWAVPAIPPPYPGIDPLELAPPPLAVEDDDATEGFD